MSFATLFVWSWQGQQEGRLPAWPGQRQGPGRVLGGVRPLTVESGLALLPGPALGSEPTRSSASATLCSTPPAAFAPCPPSSSRPRVLPSASVFVSLSPVPPPNANSLASGRQGSWAEGPMSREVTLVPPGPGSGPLLRLHQPLRRPRSRQRSGPSRRPEGSRQSWPFLPFFFPFFLPFRKRPLLPRAFLQGKVCVCTCVCVYVHTSRCT